MEGGDSIEESDNSSVQLTIICQRGAACKKGKAFLLSCTLGSSADLEYSEKCICAH